MIVHRRITLALLLSQPHFSTTAATFDSGQESRLDTPISSPPISVDRPLHITALRATAEPPHIPYLLCLQTPCPFTKYPTIGASIPLALPLSSTRNTTLVTLPPHSSEGWHNPPMPMWFVLLSGKAVVTTYDPTKRDGRYVGDHDSQTQVSGEQMDQNVFTAVIADSEASAGTGSDRSQKVVIEPASSNQFILALDLLGRGHWTNYPSDEDTWALQIPLAEEWEEELKKWEVVGNGPCS